MIDRDKLLEAITDAVDDQLDQEKDNEDPWRVGYMIAEGSRPFPIDMLRYCNCLPAREEDAHTIERTLNRAGVFADGKPPPTERVLLRRFYRGDGVRDRYLDKSAQDRWVSKFHWRVTVQGDEMERPKLESLTDRKS